MMAKRKLLDQVSDVARFRHLSLRTEEAYRSWIKRYIFYHGKRHPKELDAEHVAAEIAWRESDTAGHGHRHFQTRASGHAGEVDPSRE